MSLKQKTNTNSNNGSPPRTKKGGTLKKFTIILVAMLAFLLVLSAAAVFAYGLLTRDISGVEEEDPAARSIAAEIGSNLKKAAEITDLFKSIPERTNFVILGTDFDGQSSRTDTILVGCFNSKEKELDFISIPRDTYVVMPKERRDLLTVSWRLPPSDGVIKINAAYHYAGGKSLGVEYAVKQIEELLNIVIEYYVVVDTEAFRFIVDQVGPVWFDVPQRMYYTDPEENLYIDLQPGLQQLNGEQAEGLVRYRKADEQNPQSKSYPGGDLDRIKVQQEFVQALITQTLAKDKIIQNATAVIEMVYKYVSTNFQLVDAVKYLSFIKDIDEDSINSHTLPGKAATIKGESYFVPDYTAIQELVDAIFY